MADFHNYSDLRAINLLEKELRDVRFELRQCDGYDPAMSLAENVKLFVDAARLLGDLHRKLRKQYIDLKKESESDKSTARAYPLAGPQPLGAELGSNSVKTVAWFDGSGRSIADPFQDYHPSRESVSERLRDPARNYDR